MIKPLSASLLLVASIGTTGCEEKTPQPPLAPPKVAPGPAAAPRQATPAPATPATPTPAPAPTSGGLASVAAMGVTVDLPAGWIGKPPSNQMRLAEAEVPGPGGDASQSCLVVFSTAGGSVDDNIARWAGQVRDPQGQPAPATKASRAVNGLTITTVESVGSFAGMGDAAPKSNWMLRGAIIEAPEGLLFIKMTGPADAMTASAGAFASMLDSVRKP